MVDTLRTRKVLSLAKGHVRGDTKLPLIGCSPIATYIIPQKNKKDKLLFFDFWF